MKAYQNLNFTDTNLRKLRVAKGLFFLLVKLEKVIIGYICIGYNLNVMRQTACLAINQITVNNFAVLFNCTLVVRASGSMMPSTIHLKISLVWTGAVSSVAWSTGAQLLILFCFRYSVIYLLNGDD